MDSEPGAPRLDAFLASTRGLSAITVLRTQWDSLQVNSTQPIPIDVEATPIRGVASGASRIAVVAKQMSTGGGRVSVYRNDPQDEPAPINVDHYTVLTDLDTDPRLRQFAVAASTSVNSNLMNHLRDNVFWVKEEPGDDHWLPEVPSSVLAVVRIETSGPGDDNPAENEGC